MSLLKVLTPIGKLLKLKNVDIYNNVFKLNTKLTVTLLLAFSALVTAHEFFGKPMDCNVGMLGLKSYVDNLCWINGTYIADDVKGHIGVSLIAPGVGAAVPEHRRRYLLYYQWVGILLFIQAVFFYIPGYLWKIWEHGRLQTICKDLDTPIQPDNYNDRRTLILKYLLEDNNIDHKLYAIRFFMCEAMNVAMVIINMLLLNVIFAKFWVDYSPAVLALFTTSYADFKLSTARFFPKFAKCDYHNFGPSGSIENNDALCLLSLNVINEKIFVFIWLWYMMLVFVSILNVVYRCLCLASRTLRVKILRSHALSLSCAEVRRASNNAEFGEWFLLYQLGRNMHPIVFADIMEKLADAKRGERTRKGKHLYE